MLTRQPDYQQLSEDYQRIAQALDYLESNASRQPSLKETAAIVHLSEYHFQRMFTRWVGISPKRFLQYLTKERAKELLATSKDLLDTALQSGLSGPGRLHDLLLTCEAVTPGEYKRGGAGLEIIFGFQPTPFGECLLAQTSHGICNLMFTDKETRASTYRSLQQTWPEARLVEDNNITGKAVQQLFTAYQGQPIRPLSIFLKGTNFQIKVWEALLRIPPATAVSYQQVATFLGNPRGARAVSRAVSQNPIPLLIPCHRVIRKMGVIGGYRYGATRKKAILGWEQARMAMQVEKYSIRPESQV